MKKVTLIIAVLQILPLLTKTASPHSIDPKQLAIIDGRSYYFSTLDGNIPEAIGACADVNMTLVSLETQEEYDAVNAYIDANLGLGGYWTSGTRQYITWVWSSVGRHITYFNWYTGEPDITETSTQSNLYIYDGFMRDTIPNAGYKFICEEI